MSEQKQTAEEWAANLVTRIRCYSGYTPSNIMNTLAAVKRAADASKAAAKLCEVARVLSGHRVTGERTAAQWSRLHAAIDEYDAATGATRNG